MKKVRNPKLGMVVQIPLHQFSQTRKGWNGWIFRAAIVDKLYISSKGVSCAKVTYCSQTAGRYQLLPNIECTRNISCEYLFEYNLERKKSSYQEFLEYEKNGEKVCWDQDTALLLNHNLIG